VEEIAAQQKDLIAQASEILSLRPPLMRILLRRHKWDLENLMSAFGDKGEDWLYDDAGLARPGSKTQQKRAGATGSCLICFSDVPEAQMCALDCGHEFCLDCWREYLTVKIKEEGMNISLVTCMARGCKVIVDEVQSSSLCSLLL
jgi:ariadne-1